LTVEEVGLREPLDRVVEAPREVDVRPGDRPVLRDRRGEEVDLLVAEHVRERDLRAAVDVAAARDADVHRRTPLADHLLEPLLRALVALDQRMRRRRLEVDWGSRAGLA